jgi:hypothetical protein
MEHIEKNGDTAYQNYWLYTLSKAIVLNLVISNGDIACQTEW